jgi:type I restriction enzyme S subunit
VSNELPQGWVTTKFTELLDVNGGTQPPKSEFISEPSEGYIRLLQIRDFGSKPVPTYIPDNGKRRTCNKEDILIGRYGASVGRICTGMEGAYNVALAKVVKPDQINSGYLKYFLKSELFQQPLSLLSRSAQDGFNKQDLSEFDLLIPPENEQIRIADKLDSVLAKVDVAQVRLEKIPTLLKRFRQSVLAAAISGELTKEWRAQYDIALEDWTQTVFSELSREITVGFVGKMSDKYQESGVKFLRSQNVRAFRFNPDNLLYISKDFHREIYKSRLEEGDLAIVRSGAPGTTCVIPKDLGDANCSDLVIVRPNDQLLPEYGCIYMNSSVAQQNVIANQVGVAQQHFNVGSMKNMPISLPTIQEQNEIVRRVESLFALADAVEKQYLEAKKRIDRLTQSLLAKAFRGELMPQDPNDEPAAELLKRIQAERNAQPPVKNKRAKSA